jgi:Putative peptidoglycan binding domain
MNISPQDLAAEYDRANRDWPFITDVNTRYGFPPCLLHAVGSRETNLRNVVGDGGHGHGVFQLDDRWHQIPPGFDSDVPAQTDTAARMLAGLHQRVGDWTLACNLYNSGSTDVNQTAGHDYGPDVMARQQYLAGSAPDPVIGPSVIAYMEYGQTSDEIRRLQTWLNRMFPSYSRLPVTGYYGTLTTTVIKEFQRRVGIVGADGRNCGPITCAKLFEYGFRG